jgi:hypothetical protein
VGALASETKSYVPRVLDLYGRLKEQFETGSALAADGTHRDGQREGKTLGARTSAVLGRTAAAAAVRASVAGSRAPAAAAPPAPAPATSSRP